MVIGNNLIFRTHLPVFPNASQISDAYGYYGGGTGVQRIYFWSSSSVDEIVKYYQGFTYPFIEDNKDPGVYRTAFNPSGAPLPIVTHEFSREILDLGQTRSCYYQLPQQCVIIQIIDFGEDRPVIVEGIGSLARTVRTPEPAPADLRGGRLIVYTYYVSDIS